MSQDQIRNFCIIAHIDHGKSTLADRMLEITDTVEKRVMKSQLLDSMELEQERGITIKLAPVRMKYDYKSLMRVTRGGATPPESTPSRQCEGGVDRAAGPAGGAYDLNLIDTPGHVDFSYEVSRSLAAVEGAILVVDAAQGIQAQTLSNVYLAIEAGLKIIPVINKIDLPAADIPRVSREIISLLGCKESDILKISAKTGDGVESVLNAVIEQIPPPEMYRHSDTSTEIKQSRIDSPTRALIFDSYYDDYRGVVLYVRVVDGQIAKNDEIRMLATKAFGIALEVGHLNPKMVPDPFLATGEIGYIVTNLKTTREARVGDTISLEKYFKKSKI